MTPLAARLARLLPRPLVLPALILIYAACLLALLLFGNTATLDIAYIDVSRP